MIRSDEFLFFLGEVRVSRTNVSSDMRSDEERNLSFLRVGRGGDIWAKRNLGDGSEYGLGRVFCCSVLGLEITFCPVRIAYMHKS